MSGMNITKTKLL